MSKIVENAFCVSVSYQNVGRLGSANAASLDDATTAHLGRFLRQLVARPFPKFPSDALFGPAPRSNEPRQLSGLGRKSLLPFSGE